MSDLEVDPGTVDRITITLDVSSKVTLHLQLASDGGIQRTGDGSAIPASDAYQGTIDPQVFFRLRELVTVDLLDRAGRYRDPDPIGEPAVLSVVFHARDASTGLRFEYGAESQGPPPPVVEIVRIAVAETDAWYRREVRLTAGSTEE